MARVLARRRHRPHDGGDGVRPGGPRPPAAHAGRDQDEVGQGGKRASAPCEEARRRLIMVAFGGGAKEPPGSDGKPRRGWWARCSAGREGSSLELVSWFELLTGTDSHPFTSHPAGAVHEDPRPSSRAARRGLARPTAPHALGSRGRLSRRLAPRRRRFGPYQRHCDVTSAWFFLSGGHASMVFVNTHPAGTPNSTITSTKPPPCGEAPFDSSTPRRSRAISSSATAWRRVDDSLYFVGFGIGASLLGWLSDRYGRRWPADREPRLRRGGARVGGGADPPVFARYVIEGIGVGGAGTSSTCSPPNASGRRGKARRG